MKDSICLSIVISVVLVISCCLGYFMFGREYLKERNIPLHKVQVEYTIYTPTREIPSKRVIELKGNKFRTIETSHRGSNYINLYGYNEQDEQLTWQRGTVYNGTAFAKVDRIRILE